MLDSNASRLWCCWIALHYTERCFCYLACSHWHKLVGQHNRKTCQYNTIQCNRTTNCSLQKMQVISLKKLGTVAHNVKQDLLGTIFSCWFGARASTASGQCICNQLKINNTAPVFIVMKGHVTQWIVFTCFWTMEGYWLHRKYLLLGSIHCFSLDLLTREQYWISKHL